MKVPTLEDPGDTNKRRESVQQRELPFVDPESPRRSSRPHTPSLRLDEASALPPQSIAFYVGRKNQKVRQFSLMFLSSYGESYLGTMTVKELPVNVKERALNVGMQSRRVTATNRGRSLYRIH
ncbi:MAG TPA: hypothetical protein PKK06_06050 [Phycisphaerae bacterium]|nr:hypothetical protein [Phycisphaerae bacterium]HNU44242.1 hypothetical protein [Phycisphaerae bacterium]